MKYIGVDLMGTIWAFRYRPKFNKHFWRMKNTEIQIGDSATFHRIHESILPPLEPCCLYRIDKDCYTLIEDRRK